MAETEILDYPTERNPNRPENVLDEKRLRAVVCSALRWPTIGYGVVLVVVVTLGYIQGRSLSTQISSLRMDLAEQRDASDTTDLQVAQITATRDRESAEVAARLKELDSRVEYMVGKFDKYFNEAETRDARVTALAERMDRAAAAVNREADARRDLIRTMESFGQRLQRQ